ncbi:tRNA (guanine-N(1)-)-methyltransferase [subsurface metagenome]
MRIDILTLFPQVFQVLTDFGIFQRAVDREVISLDVHNIRDYTHDKHRTVDDYAYGGGAGMVLKPEPIFEAVEAIKKDVYPDGEAAEVPIILLTPQGRLFSHQVAQELSKYEHIIIICGHYEGIDERVREHMITDEISIGDYVLSGGELAAMVVVDTVVRLVPGVLGSPLSSIEDSHANGLLEYPQYTRPSVYRDWAVPGVLLSGNHAQVAKWRREQVIRRTLKRRPELLDRANLSLEEKQLAENLK